MSVFSGQWHSQIWPNQGEAAKHVCYHGVVLKIWFGLFIKLKQSPKNGLNRQRAHCICKCGACVLHSLNSVTMRNNVCVFFSPKRIKKSNVSSFRNNEHIGLQFSLQFCLSAIRTQVKFRPSLLVLQSQPSHSHSDKYISFITYDVAAFFVIIQLIITLTQNTKIPPWISTSSTHL